MLLSAWVCLTDWLTGLTDWLTGREVWLQGEWIIWVLQQYFWWNWIIGFTGSCIHSCMQNTILFCLCTSVLGIITAGCFLHPMSPILVWFWFSIMFLPSKSAIAHNTIHQHWLFLIPSPCILSMLIVQAYHKLWYISLCTINSLSIILSLCPLYFFMILSPGLLLFVACILVWMLQLLTCFCLSMVMWSWLTLVLLVSSPIHSIRRAPLLGLHSGWHQRSSNKCHMTARWQHNHVITNKQFTLQEQCYNSLPSLSLTNCYCKCFHSH